MTTVVTGWRGLSYNDLGENFIRTFDHYWPVEVPLTAVVDAPAIFSNRYLDRLKTYRTDDCDGLLDFINRHKANALYTGKAPTRKWRENDKKNGYSFRYDAVKFAPQLFFPELVAKDLPDDEILVWFDADVITHAPVPGRFIERLVGDDDLTFLGRAPYHSEIGFWAVRLNEKTRKFLSVMPDLYRSDEIFGLHEWHSAYVFDHVRKRMEFEGLTARNLTPGGHGHVFLQSPLGECLDHLKGRRKGMGRSPERL